MPQQNHGKCREVGDQGISEIDFNHVLDILLTLDRAVVEHSMRIYNIAGRDRFVMRAQNQRLHDAVREYLPRLVEPSRGPS